MTAIDVPRGEWHDFLDGFAHAHRDWHVNIMLAERAAGDAAGVRDMALAAILLEEGPAGHASITIETRQPEGPSASHTVADVNRVRIIKREDGVESALALESDGGSQLMLNFIAPKPGVAS